MRTTGKNINDSEHFHKTYDKPDECPLCHYAIEPKELCFREFTDKNETPHTAALFLCKHCYQVFVALYDISKRETNTGPEILKTRYIGPVKYLERSFDQHINGLSPSFVKIYNQAQEAETMGLDEIAGIGYRKALEFLIKDYLIHISPKDEHEIKAKALGLCISEKISNDKIKIVASRSAWLGNDMTHYMQRFQNKDITDMKNYIDAVVYWVSMELITEEALSITPGNPLDDNRKSATHQSPKT